MNIPWQKAAVFAALLGLAMPAWAALPIGWLDNASATVVSGWTFDPDRGSNRAAHRCVDGQCRGNPVGYLDLCIPEHVGGWARDPDYDGPIAVHIYVDGVLFRALPAGDYRPDVGAHGFNWAPPPFGAGVHQVVAYAIGVDAAGQPDGSNPGLTGSPAVLQGNCNRLTGSALAWCQGVPNYWSQRQSDTQTVGDHRARVGVDRSYGGTIFQLYGADWDQNRILEHGGGAVQLSIWGYDAQGPAAWFGNDSCDPTAYASQAACLAAGHGACVLRCCSQGSHVLDCVSAVACTGWSAGSPFNPIQAQGANCGWDGPGNDVVQAEWQGTAYYTRHAAPYHFTSTLPPAPMPMEQWVTSHGGYIEVDYRLRYLGSDTWSAHPQEIPAIFTAAGMTAHFYYYGGAEPFTGDAVTHRAGPPGSYLRYPARAVYGHGLDFIGYAMEGWWSVCDGDEDRCLTVATFDPIVNEVALADNGSGEGYVTVLGYFAVAPGMDRQWTVYLFPYRYDEVVDGRTVREHIAALAPSEFRDRACLPGVPIARGDVDNNGVLSAQDAQLGFFMALQSFQPTHAQACAADCNADGVVSASDAQAIFWAVLGEAPCQYGAP